MLGPIWPLILRVFWEGQLRISLPSNSVLGQLISDPDIRLSAKLLIDQHGEDALIFAAQQADKYLEAGDSNGCAVWKRVIQAIRELLDQKPPGDGISIH